MIQLNVKSYLFKTIGFMNYDNSFYSGLSNHGYFRKEIDTDTRKFLENSYHTEYLRIMFPKDETGVETFRKKIDYQITVKKSNN